MAGQGALIGQGYFSLGFQVAMVSMTIVNLVPAPYSELHPMANAVQYPGSKVYRFAFNSHRVPE